MSAGSLIKVGDVWIDPMRVDAVGPARDWSTDEGGWVTDPSASRLTLRGRLMILHVVGIAPDEAAALINAAILEQGEVF